MSTNTLPPPTANPNSYNTTLIEDGNPSENKRPTRQSNMEALRIVAMSMILVHHFLCHGLIDSKIISALFPLLDPFVYAGVNIFFLISGYFLIRFSLRSLVKFILQVYFFVLINLIALWSVGGDFTWRIILNQVLWPMSGSTPTYWFVKVYILLMVTSPIINAGIKSMSHIQLKTTLAIMFLVISFIGGHYGGGTYLNAFMMYILGYYISEYHIEEFCSKKLYLFGFLGCCLLISILQFSGSQLFHRIYSGFFYYDNPFIILSALFLSLFFAKLYFQNKRINSIASASFGCYLLQDGIFGFEWLYKWQNEFVVDYGFGIYLAVMLISCFIGFWILSWILTKFMNIWLSSLTNCICTIGKYVFDHTLLITSKLSSKYSSDIS